MVYESISMRDDNKYGRWFTQDQLTREEIALARKLEQTTSPKTCLRCGTDYEEISQLPNQTYYCRACILLGRLRSDQALYYFPQKRFPEQSYLNWQGKLSPWQEKISTALQKQVENGRASLVHAVTGAGKTEMIYQTIDTILKQGGAVCLASPRVDVCIELFQRLQKDFACTISLLHGESADYFRTPLVIATTHQLLKFYQAFDLLIIDEVDAFPYVDNPILYKAVDNSLKENGVRVFLTATATDRLDKMVRNGQLERLSLPRRFHGNPLVIPTPIWLGGLEASIKKTCLPTKLMKAISMQQSTGYPLLLFVAEIERGRQVQEILEKEFGKGSVGCVSSQTSDRLDQVQAFREGKFTILISTTILERGVTFPGVDVFVLESHHQLFTKSSLVQISGRVGRSMDRPNGLLYFFHNGKTRAMQSAIKEIREMNKEAKDAQLPSL